MTMESMLYASIVVTAFLLGMLVMWVVLRDVNINYIRLLNNYRVIAQDRVGIQAILEAVQEEKEKELNNDQPSGLDE